MGPAYVLVTLLYVTAFALSLGVARSPLHAAHANAGAALARLKEGLRYVWAKPDLLGAFSIAFLVNLLAFPIFLGLLPYVARDVYQIGQPGLGYLAAAFATGALTGSLTVSASHVPLRAGRVMLWNTAAWFLANFVGDVPWAHLDIAGTAYTSGDKPHQASGPTGAATRVFVELALDLAEEGVEGADAGTRRRGDAEKAPA